MSKEMRVQSFGKVVVLMGGHSAEREISLMSGQGVLNAMLSQGVNAHAFDPAKQSLSELIEQKFDRAFIALHGPYGEDGTIQGLLEQLHIPYTGSGVMASAIAMDKVMTKRLWLASGLPTPRFVLLNKDSDGPSIVKELGLPLIVKPSHEGSTLGLTKVTHVDQLTEAYQKASRFDTDVIAEEFIDGDELTCALLENSDGTTQALPLIRIIAPQANYDYEHKYFLNDTIYECPAPFESTLTQTVQALSLAAYHAVGCRGWGRADVMIRKQDNQPFLLEINTSPGMTTHSLVPMAAKETGMSYEELVLNVLDTARLDLGKKP